ncbi:DUF4190 domain-containing protein [Yinghuangia soli]|uniref:DUF4190 domain-containing protein n=1 Tax=Yinghuangia soli TaxID=2908204 RepID=A0AA41U0U7_9ACTN|nr:DUF4190 domain-containing protein [Yinghuangia soli]MCF2530158.1 DUF4190 domain-containing protein [Yinghuangia soli]
MSTPGDPWGHNPYDQQPGGYPPGGYPPPGYLPPGYQQPGYGGYGYGPQPGTNGMAIASLVLSIVCLSGVGSVLGVIFGHIALGQIERTGQQGRGMAIAGLVIGYVGLAVVALVIIIAIANPSAFDEEEMLRTYLTALAGRI